MTEHKGPPTFISQEQKVASKGDWGGVASEENDHSVAAKRKSVKE